MKIDKPIYAPSGKYKLALNDKGDITFIDTVPSDKVDIVYTEPLTEYLAPEAFVSQNGVQALVDPETGEYTFTPQSVAIVNEEHHRPLNPYTRYMLQKGVAPKDSEVEHLMERHRADLAGERADLSPFFANLMTGMYAGAAEAGWDDIKKGNYFSGASEVLSPLMFGENAWNKVAQGLYGGIHFLNENGVPKTWREIKEGNYGNAALSGAGDVFNLALTGPITRRPRIYLSNLLGLSKRSPKVSERIVFDVDKNSEYYKQLVNRYGEKLANEIIEKFKTKEFQDYFLAGDLESAQREISDYALIRDTDDLIRGNPDMGKGALTGSSAVASKGTIHRPSAVSHDLDYAVYSTNPLKNIYGGTQEEVKSALDLLFGNPKESIINSPAFLNFVQTFNLENAPVFNIPRWLPRWMVPRDKTGAIYLTPMFNVGNGGINRTVQTTVNGVPIDLFFGGNYIPEGPIKGIVDASIPLGWKRQWVNATKYPREKDLRDLKEYMDFGPDNPLIDLRTGQSLYSPFMFGNRITTPEGYPIILEIETYPGSRTTIPVTMNHKGQFQIINNGISKTVQPNGTIKLSLPSHTNSKPRQFVLEPAGDNKYYVHMKVWDDIKNKVPGNISNEEKLQLFEALYNELPEGAEILMPKSSSEYLATRGTVAGLQRLSRDSRFTPGTKGVLYYTDKNRNINTFNGSSFIKNSSSKISDVRGIEGRPKTWEEVVLQIKQGKDDFVSEIESDIYKAVADANKTEAEKMGLAYIPTYEKPAFISTKNGINFKFENLSPTEAANWNSVSRTVTINKRLPENVSLRNAVAHEVTHAGEHGTPDSSLLLKALKIAEEKGIPLKDVPEYLQLKKLLEYLRFKSGQIFKPGSDYAGKFDLSEHGGEAVANARDFGKEIGVKFGEEYPGYEEAYRRIMSNIDGSKAGLLLYFKLDEEHMPYVWNSLNGTHFFTGTQETLPGVKFRGIIPKGEGNPLDTRLQRMMLRSKLKQENPEIYNLIYDENNPFVLPDLSISIVPRVRYDNIRKAMLDIDPNLSDVDLDMGIQIALANKKGVHFDLGNKSGDTIGGVNIVEIADAVNMVRKLHGREAIPYDISMIAGHELGHGVQLSDDALRAVSGYYDPYEFYTQAGQVLDNAGIINNTLSPLSFNKFINLTNSYLANGNLDNGITKMRDFLMSLSPLERLAVMKNINRFSAGLFGAYLIGKGIKNGKVLS